jgi:mono/diheme cytochrome c family protein
MTTTGANLVSKTPPYNAALAAIVVGLALVLAPRPSHADEPEKPLSFERDVAPILNAHCLKCHGSDDPQGGLDLTTIATLMKGSDEGPVVIKGSPDKSVMLQKVAKRQMPPPKEKDSLSDGEVAAIRRWIDAGGPGNDEAANASTAAAPVVTDDDRNFWAFVPPVAAPVPEPNVQHRVRTPVDSFLLMRLEAKGLTFSPEASRPTLLRRASLDLVGLPPTPEEIQSFLADESPDAFERQIDRLLESPHYGERWGRHWLDVAGFTDSPHYAPDKAGNVVAFDDWRYRDYVVRSFNQDKPYDRFLMEQLAGDELVDWKAATSFTPEILDPLIATGFLRTTPDWTHSVAEYPNYRFDTLSRVVDHVSTGVLGLTMGCVRCHRHKFDPIPHEDYYRLMAVFATAYNPDDWLKPVDRYLADVPPPDKAEVDRHNAMVESRSAEIAKELENMRAPHGKQIRAAKLEKLPEVLRADIESALATAAAQRTEVQKYLAGKFEALLAVSDQELTNSLSETEKQTMATLGNENAALLASKRLFGRIQGLFDVGKPPEFHLLIRGDATTPGKVVEAGFPAVLCPSGRSAIERPPETKGDSSGRRLALAKWLTRRDHPLTARVMVNRVWEHHFGRGIVATPENFGHSGMPPTHPELLDWLAVDFMEHCWSVKRLHRLLMTSTAYRQTARRPQEGEPSAARTVDPENELLWRMNLRRMEAEVLRDSVLAVSGKLDCTPGGAPVPVEANPDGLVTVSEKGPTPTSKWRRSLYVKSLRGSHPLGQGFKLSMFEIFDYPEIVINCTHRTNSTTPLQSLALVNSKFMLEHARHFADRVRTTAGAHAPPEKTVESAFVLALGRLPTAAETGYCLEHLRAQADVYANMNLTPEQVAQQALASLCLMILASNEFLYIG